MDMTAPESLYTNPVYDGYLGDPFVLKFNGEYYAYGTVPIGDCRIPVLHSRDLVHWALLGHALMPLDAAGNCYWAPEVVFSDGVFYMYYSAGGWEGEGHQLRVATADIPTGPFTDSGAVLAVDDPFTIDAHPYRGDDGQWYLYYSRDFLEGEYPGTGIVVDRLVDMRTLAGERAVVVRPHAGWHLFERQRHWYDRVWDWYTIEGAAVRTHGGNYYCFYSGGLWKAANYGVSYVAGDGPMGPFRSESGAQGPDVIRTVPGQVIGPGHISVVLGPDNTTEYVVYHAWDPEHTGRLMRLDRLLWGEAGPYITGPSLDPQPAPPMPAFRDLFDGDEDSPLGTDPAWDVTGDWRLHSGEVVASAPHQNEARALIVSEAETGGYLLEVNARAAGDAAGEYGMHAWYVDEDNFVELVLREIGPELLWRCVAGGQEVELQVLSLAPLGSGFRPTHYHQFLLRKSGAAVDVRVDGVPLATGLPVPPERGRLGLFVRGTRAAFDGVALTHP